MSSYHSSFTYLGKNSKNDFNLIIAHFSDNADSGETDTFLSTSAVYSDSYDGTRQRFYGTKYDTVAEIQITVIKQDGTDFGIEDNRKALRWLTGSRQATWMDFYIGEEVKYRLLGHVKSVSQYKMDARIVGLVITFESVSPYGYSSLQTISQSLTGKETLTISCDSDDLYSYVQMNTTFTNTNSNGSLIITNHETEDITEVSGLVANEIVTISDNMVITSDKPSKTFGNTFNFVFPRLVAGDNRITIEGKGSIIFEYITPVKLGNIAIDINSVTDPICDSNGQIQVDTLDWNRISNTPTTLSGYGISNAYTKTEVDNKIANVTVNNVYTKAEVDGKIESINNAISNVESNLADKYYTKVEVDNIVANLNYDPSTGEITSISWAQITGKPTTLSGYGIKTEVENLIQSIGAVVNIDRDELYMMFAEVLV